VTPKEDCSREFRRSSTPPQAVALMWRTAPPRMPLEPAKELCRLGAAEPTIEEAIA
jgi:hypothetical protein